MDVERIQKINNLALDLMKQGLASDRENAIAQAEKIYRDGDSEDYNSIKETMEEVNKGQTREEEKPQEPGQELSQDEIKQTTIAIHEVLEAASK